MTTKIYRDEKGVGGTYEFDEKTSFRNPLLKLAFVVALAGVSFVSGYTHKQETLDKPKIIWNYVGRDGNGKYDSYELINRFSDGQEKVISNRFGRTRNNFCFHTPFGGEIREASRDVLQNIFIEYNYPDVDKIRFK